MTTPRAGVDIGRPRPPTAFDLFPSSDVSSWLDSLQAKIHQGLAGDPPPLSSRSPSPLRADSPQPSVREENGYSHSVSDHQGSTQYDGLFGDEDEGEGEEEDVASDAGQEREGYGDEDNESENDRDERQAGREASAASQPSVASSSRPSYRQVSQDEEVYEIVDSDDEQEEEADAEGYDHDDEAEGEDEDEEADVATYEYDARFSYEMGEWDDNQATPYDEDEENASDEDAQGGDVTYDDLDLDAQYDDTTFSPRQPASPDGHTYKADSPGDHRDWSGSSYPQHRLEEDEDRDEIDDDDDEDGEDEEGEASDEEELEEDEGEEEDEDEEDEEEEERHDDHPARTPPASTPGRGSVNEPIELLESDDEDDEDEAQATASSHRRPVGYDDQVDEIDEDDDEEDEGVDDEHEDADDDGSEDPEDSPDEGDEPMEVDRLEVDEDEEEERSPTPPPLAAFNYSAILQDDALLHTASGLNLTPTPGTDDIASALSHLVGAAPGHESHGLDIASIPIDPELLGQASTSAHDIADFFMPSADGEVPHASSSSMIASAESVIPQFAGYPSQPFDTAAEQFANYLEGGSSSVAGAYDPVDVNQLHGDYRAEVTVNEELVVGVTNQLLSTAESSQTGSASAAAVVTVIEEVHATFPAPPSDLPGDSDPQATHEEIVQPDAEPEVESESPAAEEAVTSVAVSSTEDTPELIVFNGEEDETPAGETPDPLDVIEAEEEADAPAEEDADVISEQGDEVEEEAIVVEEEDVVVEEEDVVIEEEEVVEEDEVVEEEEVVEEDEVVEEEEVVEVEEEEERPAEEAEELELDEIQAEEEPEQVEVAEEDEPEPLESKASSEEPESLQRDPSPEVAENVEEVDEDRSPSTPDVNTPQDTQTTHVDAVDRSDKVEDITASEDIDVTEVKDAEAAPSTATAPILLDDTSESQPGENGDESASAEPSTSKLDSEDVATEEEPPQAADASTQITSGSDKASNSGAAVEESTTAEFVVKKPAAAEQPATDRAPAPAAVPRPLHHNHQRHRDTLAPTAPPISAQVPASPSHRRTRSSLPLGSPPITRSHCMFHKLQVADGDLSCVAAAPQCALSDREKIREEQATVLGEITPEEKALLDDNTLSVLDLHPALRSKLSRIGVLVDNDDECYILSASEGAMEDRRSPRKERRLSSRPSVGRSTKSPDPRAFGSPSQAQATPRRNTRALSGGPNAVLAVSPVPSASKQLHSVSEATEDAPALPKTPQAGPSRLLPEATVTDTPTRRITRSMRASVDPTDAPYVADTKDGLATGDDEDEPSTTELKDEQRQSPQASIAASEPEETGQPDIEMEDQPAPSEPPAVATSPAMGTRARKRKAEQDKDDEDDLPAAIADSDEPEAKRHAAESAASEQPQPKRSRWGRFWPFG